MPTLRNGPAFGAFGASHHGCGGAVGGKRCWEKDFDRGEPFLARCGRVDAVRITSVDCRCRFGNAPSGGVDAGFTSGEFAMVSAHWWPRELLTPCQKI